MATITDPDIVRIIVENNGYVACDPQAVCVWEYTSSLTDRPCWAVYWDGSTNTAEAALKVSPYVVNPRLIWSRERGKINEMEVFDARM